MIPMIMQLLQAARLRPILIRSICIFSLMILLLPLPAGGSASTADATSAGTDLSDEATLLFSIAGDSRAEEITAESGLYRVLPHRHLMDQELKAGQMIRVVLPDGELLTYRITGVSRFVEPYLAVRAVHPEDPHEQIVFSYGDGKLVGQIQRFGRNELILIHPQKEDFHSPESRSVYNHTLKLSNPQDQDILECGVDHSGEKSTVKTTHQDSGTLDRLLFFPFESADSHMPGIPVDLLIAYTDKAKKWADGSRWGSIEAVISEMMNLSHQVLENSGLDIELRPVHIFQTEFSEAGRDSENDLRRITASGQFNPFGEKFDGYAPDLHQKRDQYGADLVAVIAEIEDVGGIAWQLNNVAGTPSYGFSLNRVQQMASSYTFIHEIGHNMGSAHSRNQVNSASNVFGGLFDYATGWRTSTSSGNSYATVMTYLEGSEGNSQRIPFFSSPGITYMGEPIGSYEETYAPADNVRSLQYSRHIVSQYRPSLIDPPLARVYASEIEAEGNPDRPIEIRLPLGNAGSGTLYWTLDAKYPESGPLLKSSASAVDKSSRPLPIPSASSIARPYLRETIPQAGSRHKTSSNVNTVPQSLCFNTCPDHPDHVIDRSPITEISLAQISPTESHHISPVLFSTLFGMDEDYSPGTHQVLNSWVTFPALDPMFFEITSENPSNGLQHLRIRPNPERNPDLFTGVQVPFPGPLVSQSYLVSMDLYFHDSSDDDQFHVYMDASSTRKNTVWSRFTDGDLIVRNGPDSYVYAAQNIWEPGKYYRYSVLIDPGEQQIIYYLDGEPVFHGNLYGGSAPEQILLVHRNRHNGKTIDIDNLIVQTPTNSGIPRFPFSKPSGFVEAGNLDAEAALQLIPEDLDEGSYSFNLVLQTNDPTQQTLHIPVKLNIHNEPTSTIPAPANYHFKLLANYPNPFNPSTVIEFEISDQETVTLQIYDIAGRLVETLLYRDNRPAGRHRTVWNAPDIPSGVYLYRLQTESGMHETRNMILLR